MIRRGLRGGGGGSDAHKGVVAIGNKYGDMCFVSMEELKSEE